MPIIINYPNTNKEMQLFLNNLAIFKAELLLKNIDNMNLNEDIKDKVLKKLLAILNDKSKDSVI